MDTVDKETRSNIMRAIKGFDTKPEIKLRRALEELSSLPWPENANLPGRPDCVNGKVAVFVHGCFWHGCPTHYKRPATNTKFWDKKLKDNRSRDRRVTALLRGMGYKVFVVWECCENYQMQALQIVKEWEKCWKPRSRRTSR